MSYQNADDDAAPGGQVAQGLRHTQSQHLNWKTVTLAIGVTMCLFVLVSQNNGSSHIREVNVQVDASTRYSTMEETEISFLFSSFKSKFHKSYGSSEEEAEKFSNFKSFLELVDERNDAELINGGSAVHGITQFADISQTDFESTYLGYKPVSTRRALKGKKPTIMFDTDNSSGTVSWVDVYTTSVNNQGDCGSCWAFSSVEQIESDSIRLGLTNTSEKLSYQQVVACDSGGSCYGGDTEQAYQYVMRHGGLETDLAYPYASINGTGNNTCTANAKNLRVTVDDYYSYSTEEEMEAHVTSTGPLSVCLDAESWSSYTSGVISVCNTTADHCVQAVGINLDEGYWIIRNSWGTTWGVGGYIYLQTGENMCDITSEATYTEPVLV